MKKSIKKLSMLMVVYSIVSSCNTTPDLDYENSSSEYKKAVECLQSNHVSIFSDNRDNNSVDIYSSERTQNGICENVLKGLEKHSVNLISYFKDSTVFFYSKQSGGIPSRQAILSFATTKEKLESKITSDMTIVKIEDTNWYLLKKVISIAN